MTKLPPSWYAVAKRTLDMIAALVGLIVLCPLLLAIAAAIKMTSPGHVLYRGIRTGKHGRPFRIYKFRSMAANGERLGGTTTGQHDVRVTTVGAFLRKYKLDELPQLLNVLRGDMSLVGPRPEVPEYTDQYNREEQRILSVRPGITDLASLEFHDLQSIVGCEDPDRTYRERVLPRKNQLRLQYVDTRSLLGDMLIVLRTLATIVVRSLRYLGVEARRHHWKR